jgi:hypothetical protein
MRLRALRRPPRLWCLSIGFSRRRDRAAALLRDDVRRGRPKLNGLEQYRRSKLMLLTKSAANADQSGEFIQRESGDG